MKYEKINLPNGLSVIVGKSKLSDGRERTYLGIGNENGYVITDRVLTDSEVNKVNSIINDDYKGEI